MVYVDQESRDIEFTTSMGRYHMMECLPKEDPPDTVIFSKQGKARKGNSDIGSYKNISTIS